MRTNRRGCIVCSPGQSRSGTSRARAIDSLQSHSGSPMRKLRTNGTGGTPVSPGSIALRLTNANNIKCKNRADYTKSTRFNFCPSRAFSRIRASNTAAGKPGRILCAPYKFLRISAIKNKTARLIRTALLKTENLNNRRFAPRNYYLLTASAMVSLAMASSSFVGIT